MAVKSIVKVSRKGQEDIEDQEKVKGNFPC